jgi:hypothetical protein
MSKVPHPVWFRQDDGTDIIKCSECDEAISLGQSMESLPEGLLQLAVGKEFERHVSEKHKDD